MRLRKWRRYVRRRLNRKPQIIPPKIHYPGLEMRIIIRDNVGDQTLYQSNCERMRLIAIGSNPIRGEWISLLNAPEMNIYFSYPIDVQIRPMPGVRTPHEEEHNAWN